MDWKVFYTTDKAYKVELIKNILAESNIVCKEVSNKDSGLKIGGIDLYVHEENVEKAKEIIENHPEL